MKYNFDIRHDLYRHVRRDDSHGRMLHSAQFHGVRSPQWRSRPNTCRYSLHPIGTLVRSRCNQSHKQYSPPHHPPHSCHPSQQQLYHPYMCRHYLHNTLVMKSNNKKERKKEIRRTEYHFFDCEKQKNVYTHDNS